MAKRASSFDDCMDKYGGLGIATVGVAAATIAILWHKNRKLQAQLAETQRLPQPISARKLRFL